MSVADILAAARGATATPAAEKPAAAKPAASAAPAGAAKKPGAMSVSDILAAARSGGATPAAAPAAQPAAPKPKPAAKAASKVEAAAPASVSVDTSSILAAARSGAKAGPVSKSEAAAMAPPAKPKPALLPMPEKPAYAMPKAPAAAATDRRGFFSVFFGSFLALGFTAFGLTNLLWVLGVARYMFPNILIEPPSKFRVGFPNDFAPGSVSDKFKAQFGIWIVRAEYEGQPQIVALKTVCTHLGCTPNWLEAEQKYKCPCHGSGFYKDGINFEGPAPRPLERYAISIAADGQLEVDKSKTFQQEMGQWTNTASFVIV
jgi:cytochrome b6-f complex iron-sulfur subunit